MRPTRGMGGMPGLDVMMRDDDMATWQVMGGLGAVREQERGVWKEHGWEE